MSAAEALHIAHAAGVTVMLDGDSLLLEADTQPPQAVLDALSRHKAAIVALLRPGQGGWATELRRVYFDKRAEIAASHRLPRGEAEALAFACCVIEWLNQHPTPSAPGRCVWCGKPESPSAVVLPFGAEPGTHTWLHAECWRAWHQRRRGEAVKALGAMGITPGTGST
jgi:hypothetical protein